MRTRLLTLLAALAIAVAACTPAENGNDNDDLIDPGGFQSPAVSDGL
jgi:hypothetical protein